MKKILKYNHTEAFYKKQYKKYLDQIEDNVFGNYNTFKSAYRAAEKSGMSEITKNFVYESKYEINWDTYKAERDAIKEMGVKASKQELLSMSTTQFAEKYKDKINDLYWEFRSQGATSSELKDFIGAYFFGSK